MKVRELIQRLQEVDPEAEAHYCDPEDWNGSTEIYEVYESTAKYGYALPGGPTEVKTVVLATGTEGI